MARQRFVAQARRGSGGLETEAVRVWLLGGFRVTVGSRTIEENEWRLKKAGSLVKLLALAPGHRMHREQAMELLWPGLDPEPAANNLHYALHVARRTLEPAAPADNTVSRYLVLRGDLLALCPEDGPLLWVDVEAFEGAATAARRSREPAAYRAAAELYVGDLLPEDLYEKWTEEKREELRRWYHALLLELAALHEECEEYEPGIQALQRVVAEEPTREEAHVGLMRLYALSGQRHEAILQYGRLGKILREELDEEPGGASQRLYEEIRARKFPAAPSPAAAGRPSEGLLDPSPNNLPASLTSFVGRESALLEVKRLLSMTQLLTLTGAGGSGKTRLALEVARDLVGAYPEGVWLVELAPLSEPALVAQAVAAALGVREQPGRSVTQTLSHYLKSRQTLLVLDNCEHLVDAAAHLAEALLSACPKLRILATSREPLGVPGEVVWTVSPLSLPDVERASTIESLMSTEAVRLFVDRARSRLPTFELSRENTGAVMRVCHKLEGIPLAIELATGRMGALAVEQIAERLEDSLKLLSGAIRTVDPRHQTMRAALAWSHDPLDEPERRLFGRLSVFAGGWTLEAAEEVCSGIGIERDDVLDLLSRLVDKSLVVAEASPKAGASLRYRMLEPVRQYGREKLENAAKMAARPGETPAVPETERVRERHAGYYLELAERVEPELTGARPVAWLELLGTEYGNLRAALSWTLDADDEETGERAEMGLRLAAALGRFWDAYGPGEGRRWLEKGLARSRAAPASVRAKAFHRAGFIAIFEVDPAAMELLEEGLALYKKLGDEYHASCVYSDMAHALLHVGPRERAASLREEVETLLASEPSDNRVRAQLLMFLGFAAGSEFDFDQMESRLEQALALHRELEDVRNMSECLLSLGYVYIGRDDPGGAVRFEEGLRYQKELKNMTAIFMGVGGMAGIAALRGEPSRSARLMGASEALREEIGFTFESLSKSHYDYPKYFALVRGALGEVAFEAAFSEGRAMSPEQAIEYALSEEGERKPPTRVPAPEQESPADEPADLLTPREQEIALLVGRELTNRQIASELSISEHTVANHVAKILGKLGLRSRAQIGSS